VNNKEAGLDLKVFVGEGASPVINCVAVFFPHGARAVNKSLNLGMRIGASGADILEKNQNSYIVRDVAARKVRFLGKL
jgi:hypothetical protein